jgi:hypothetical protein
MDKNLLNMWLGYFKMACKMYHAYLISIYDLDDYSCLSIYSIFMKWNVWLHLCVHIVLM